MRVNVYGRVFWSNRFSRYASADGKPTTKTELPGYVYACRSGIWCVPADVAADLAAKHLPPLTIPWRLLK